MLPSRNPADPRPAGAQKSWLQMLKEADAHRPDFPGEHAIALGVGVLLLLSSGRSRSVVGRLLKAAAGGALIGRAASGSGGIERMAQTMSAVASFLPRR